MAEKRRGKRKDINSKASGNRKAAKRKRPLHNLSPNAILHTMNRKYDMALIALVTILTLFGIVMVFSAGYYSTASMSGNPYYYLTHQGMWAVTGAFWMFIFAHLDYHWYSKYYVAMVLVSLGLLMLLFTPLGVEVNYATRWFAIGPLRLTPSELSKLFMIIATSAFLAEKPERIRSAKGILALVVVMGIHAVLIIKQPNLSTAVVIVAIMLGVMFVAGTQMWLYAGAVGLGAFGTFYILNFQKDTHWYSRLTNFIDPFKDAQGEGYQVSQSLIALGNGGIKGLGLGNSISKNLYLPEPQNDFILAIIGEELGFVGILILMSVYMLLIYRCFMIAASTKDKLGLFIASGVTIMLGLQVIINVAVVTASMPATGITLPFVSYGGTSIWVFMMAMGIMLNISKQNRGRVK